MAWHYHQLSGVLTHNGHRVERGYSGAGHTHSSGRNNPDMETVKAHGPIPRGQWKIGPPYRHENLGPVVMNLSPINHDAHGRDLFRIHGNNTVNDASHGCIIMSRPTRERIANSGDPVLFVHH